MCIALICDFLMGDLKMRISYARREEMEEISSVHGGAKSILFKSLLEVMILEPHGDLSIARFCCPAVVLDTIGTTAMRKCLSQLTTQPNLHTMVAQQRLSAAQLCRYARGNPTPSTTTLTKRRAVQF